MILLSGGFDPLHVGHVRMIRDAMKYSPVVVAVNSDEWLMRKKGFVFMPWNERCEILEAMGVQTYAVDDRDDTVCEAIRTLKPDFFGNGGDRGAFNTPEADICAKMNIPIIYELGGGKVQSSSSLTGNYIEKRVWGEFEVLHEGNFKVKILRVKPNQGISIQSHRHRNEHWIFPDTDDYEFIAQGQVHCLHNPTDETLEVVEVQTGTYFGEDDETKYFTNQV
jgi:D-beta-D-heptose 7-phosphate kinase/D-beta-D-heptose 1-phosphate adenosyltransferase